MSKLVLANAELSDAGMANGRTQPLIMWFYFLNFVTVGLLSLLFLKIYNNFLLLYEWFRPVKNVSKCPNILVLGPKNEIIYEVVYQLSRTFQSEVIECQDVNDNSLRVNKPKKKLKKSRIILSHIPLSSKEVVIEFKTFVEKTFGIVDILVVSQNEEPLENKSTHCFLDHLNKQLLSQFWAVMTFLPGMLSRNRGHILSVALEKSSLTNTGGANILNYVTLQNGRTEFSKNDLTLRIHNLHFAKFVKSSNFPNILYVNRMREGIMRSIHEELLQLNTNVKLTLVESNLIFDNCYLPPLSADVLARLIVWSMWTCSSVVKVPSIPSYVIMFPIDVVRCMIRPMYKVVNPASNDFTRRWNRGIESTN